MFRIIFVFVICAVSFATLSAQSPSPAPPSPSPNPASSFPPGVEERVREGLKSMAEQSRNLSGWGLAIIGASVIGIASTSYLRPLHRKVRLIYLLFIPGWFLVGWSIYNGDQISRHQSAAVFTRDLLLLADIGDLMNTQFDRQITHLQLGLTFFGLWLLVFTLWWIFSEASMPKKS